MFKTLLFSIILLIPVISVADDAFLPGSGTLHMPNVIVGTECYKINLKLNSSFFFEIVSVTPSLSELISERVTVEPDDFKKGSNISNSTAGVILSAIGSDNFFSSVFSELSSKASTGSQIFAYNNDELGGQWFKPRRILRIDFEALTNFISVEVRGFDSFDAGVLEIYSEAGVLLESITSEPLTDDNSETISSGLRSTTDIAYALVFGPNSTDTVAIDNLQFNKQRCKFRP